MKTMGKVEIKVLPLADIEPNKGQIEGVPKNPRFIKDERYKLAKKSIEDDPEMLSLREIVVYKQPATNRRKQKYVVVMGNQRHRAMIDLGYTEAVCKVLPTDTPVNKLKAFIIKDNGSYGQNDMDILANQFDADYLNSLGIDVSAYMVKEQDFEDSNQEMNMDDFDEEMKMEINFTPDDYNEAKTALALINNSPEMAMLAITGWNEETDVF